MSVKQLVEWIGSPNIIDSVLELSYEDGDSGEDRLSKLADQVCRDAQRDEDSMKDWVDLIEDGRKVSKQETSTKSQPWEGASNFKSPAILGASINFGDRASTELLRSSNLLSADVIGKDSTGEKKKITERVTEYMNWQLNYEMEDWRDIQEKLLYELPNTGCVFKKIYFDTVEQINRSELIRYPDFIVSQSRQSMNDRLPFTQPMAFSYGEVLDKQAAGLWSEEEIYPADCDDSTGSNAEEQAKTTLDNPEVFFEQSCFFDLDGDGYAEPYTVMVHKATRKVMRVVPRYIATGIYVKDDKGKIGTVEKLDAPADKLQVVKVTPCVDFVKYDFIPSFDGTFLGLGNYHLLTSLSKATNSTTNQLMDSGSLANMQGGFASKGFRKRMGSYKFKPGTWESTDLTAADLQNGLLRHQFKEPSQTLFALNEKLSLEIDKLSMKIDLKGIMAPNAPASTTLALIQEAAIPTSALMQRIIRSESKEFRRLFELNAIYVDEDTYQEVLDDKEASYRVDFDIKKINMVPTASAEMSTKMQRIQQAQALVSEAPNIGMLGGDIRPIYEAYFDAIGAEKMIGEVWPDPETMTAQQKQRSEEMKAKQQQDKLLLGIEIDHKERALEVDEMLAQSDIALKTAELHKTLAEVGKTESEMILNFEKTDSEAQKNQINMYTAELAGIREAKETIKQAIEANNDSRNARKTETSSGAAPVHQGGIPPVV